jgi:secreted PhoX family phosphatase
VLAERDIDPEDISTNPSGGRSFQEVVNSRLSRRNVLAGGMAVAAGFLTTGIARAAPATTPATTPTTIPPQTAGQNGSKGAKGPKGPLLGYAGITLSADDEVHVPAGYTARAFIPWGTPILGDYPAFEPGRNTAAEQEQQIGMHHDGMHYFPLQRGRGGSRHGLLVVNHEYTDEGYLHTGAQYTEEEAEAALATWSEEMVRKSQAAVGVSVVEVEIGAFDEWQVVRSGLNRRITANTPMSFSGPAAGHPLVRTDTDPTGVRPLGTFNNCSHGYTPWDTYLTCEENFNGFFAVEEGDYSEEQEALIARYGVGGDNYNWATNDDRFVVTPADPNEPNRHGWVVEIDPFDPHSTPVKHTALGRLKHEGAHVHVAKGDRVVVYTGDDQVNEYMYKFVSADSWRFMRDDDRSPLSEGTLYVARYNDDGSGEWLPLVHGEGPLTEENGFADQGEVLVKARLAASCLEATRMDRPEWATVDPTTELVYLTLTNNTSDEKVVNNANPRKPNVDGHIIRWEETGGDHTATTFTWDLFVIAGDGRNSGDGSTIPDEEAFGSPDGLWADPDGRIWIQTDGSQPSDTNNQMLAADPGVLDAQGAPVVKRFFTGVRGCEVTGVIATPDQTTMFVNIQHPGEFEPSTWPQIDSILTPRAATVVITKDDGGVIGS